MEAMFLAWLIVVSIFAIMELVYICRLRDIISAMLGIENDTMRIIGEIIDRIKYIK